jgi:hypothetical protein
MFSCDNHPSRSHPENQTLEKMNWNIHALYELTPEEIKIVNPPPSRLRRDEGTQPNETEI